MNVYLSIAKEYFVYTPMYNTLRRLNIREVLVDKVLIEDHLEALRGKFNLTNIGDGQLFNVLREDVDLCVICTDGEDPDSVFLMKYCIKHRIPMLMFTNLDEETNCLLEIV